MPRSWAWQERGRLTDLQIRHWIKAGAPLAKADGGGLTFTLSAGGAAGWVLRYSHGGRRRELTIGRYPDIGLADARGIATIKRAEILQGRNPAADKQKAKATAAKDWTVRELAKDYRAKKLTSLAHSTQVSCHQLREFSGQLRHQFSNARQVSGACIGPVLHESLLQRVGRSESNTHLTNSSSASTGRSPTFLRENTRSPEPEGLELLLFIWWAV